MTPHPDAIAKASFSRRIAPDWPILFGLGLLLYAAHLGQAADSPSALGNSLTYLDSSDPFYVSGDFPRLTTPQWIGEPDVDAVVVLAIDDMTETQKYEAVLRPLLNRLKQIDGRAPVSIMTRSIPPGDPLAQQWLKEGLSLEVHTLQHPCPLLANGDFTAAATNYYGCLDLLAQIPGNIPVAFRMPCCDSMDSTSPRFFTEIFNQASPGGRFLSIDSSVMNLLTTNDTSLPRELVMDPGGRERFRKYFPAQTNAQTKVSLAHFATTVENYPYPYIINKVCWEFPCAVPSDWEAFNYHGATNELTVADWKAGLDAVVIKKGVFTMIFHPYNWVRSDQLVELIDYAAARYGKRVKFLTFREALERLNQNLLMGQPLRSALGTDNGVRLMDLNGDGYLDAIIANASTRSTRIWNPSARLWKDQLFPTNLVSSAGQGGLQFGIIETGKVSVLFRTEDSKGAWTFDGNSWREQTGLLAGLTLHGEPILTSRSGKDRGVRLRDVDGDGRCELIIGNQTQNAVFKWSTEEATWKKLAFALPEGTSIVGASGQDSGLRFVDLNGDGYDDVLFSNEKGYSVHLYIAHPKPWLGWEVGWSYKARSGPAGGATSIPMIVRGGPHPGNGAWFHGRAMWVQNEDTSGLPDKVFHRSCAEIQLSEDAPAKSAAEALAAFHVADGFQIELVASEPKVVDPVAFDWGSDGKLWVVEMRDYPLGMDNRGKAGGVVRVLEDTQGDGHYDKSTVFLQGIRFPNGIMSWGKGVIISAAPDIIYAEDTDGDGVADVQRLLYTGFNQGNQQHRVNGFEYGLDNWVYAANGGSGGIVRSVKSNEELNLSGHDLRILPEEGVMELQPGATQFGRHRDDWGDWFGNDNSHWLWHYFLPERYVIRNPYLSVGSLSRQLAHYPAGNRIFARSRPQQRFNWPGAQLEVTSACSATPYRDALFGGDFEHSVFICEPANNVIHREVLEDKGVSFVSHRAISETNSEFLASEDNWCRPVMVKTGPDGALYFADMYRLIIEHPEYFPDELKTRPDLRAGEDKGRIYRVYPKDVKLRAIPRLDRLDTPGLVAALDSENGWQRDTAQRLLVRAPNVESIPLLEKLYQTSSNPKARLQAVCTLSGLNALKNSVLLQAMKDSHWAVRRKAIILAEPRLNDSPELASTLLALENDPDLRVRYQLAFSLGEWKTDDAGRVLGRMMLMEWAEPDMQIAMLSSSAPHLAAVLDEVFRAPAKSSLPSTLAEQLIELGARSHDDSVLAEIIDWLGSAPENRHSAWQVAGLAGLLDALNADDKNWDDFEKNMPRKPAVARLRPLFAYARELANNPGIPDVDRLHAIRLGGRGPSVERTADIEHLGSLLGPQQSTAVQLAALASLQHCREIQVARVLLKSWREYGLNLRQAVLNALLTRPDWTEELLRAVEQRKLSVVELGPLHRQKLLSISAFRERVAGLFSSVDADRRKIVERYKEVPNLEGNRMRGRELFMNNCSICHRLHGEGQSVGPDLGSVADKPITELVVSILDPNQAVDPSYTGYNAVTKDDRELSGILVAETTTSISLKTAGGGEEQLLRSNLKQLTSSGRSLMPEGFEAGLKPQDLADLIAFLLRP